MKTFTHLGYRLGHHLGTLLLISLSVCLLGFYHLLDCLLGYDRDPMEGKK